MTGPSPVPRRVRTPNWLSLRLVTGVVLVVAAVLAGALVIARADRTDPVWAASRDLAAGTVLTAADVRPARVRLGTARDGYSAVSTSLVGQSLSRPVSVGELVPRAAVGSTASGTQVTVPLDADQAPGLAQGQRIRVWVSTKSCVAVVVLADVTVQGVQSASGGAFSSGSGQDVVVLVPQSLADRLITALGLPEATLRAGVLSGPVDPQANASLPALTGCQTGG